jgi:DNA-binding NarL/FixJ family response regulator
VDRLAAQQATAEALRVLEEAVGAVAQATHRALTVAQRLDEALAGLGPTGGDDEPVGSAPLLPARNRLVRPGVVLSRREQEVLALVAEGHSNKAIAEALFVSPNTIKTHVASLLTKLRADSRVQLAAIGTRQELYRRDASGVSRDPVPLARSHAGR